ncbi:phage portal protein family protein [Williamwhitmania taraxaci]|uniref:Mu-like prophage protein gp29 n=1 Tax=Williamwhitmania taraxaci TaxID=1640674 RepID=A0A1G6MBZ1_9BACT|nr:DUF935 family protein [Williamwhitmania taraxaci]SDC53029.1 Mu-like prophage protein gp29 [Williamwhitmania taraxaci]
MDFSTTSKSYLFGLFKAESKAPVKRGNGDSSIIMQLTNEFSDRARVDIRKWRDALEAADNPDDPRWSTLQDLYANLLTDGHLTAVINLRKAATLSNRFIVRDAKTGKEVPELTTLLKTEWFYQMLEHLLDSVFFKYTVMELVDPVTMRWALIPRRNCAPQRGMVYFEVAGTKGVNYTDPAFSRNILSLESLSPYGLLNNIVPQLIWKRNAQQTWADFSERFGIPMISAETTKTDKPSLDKIEKQVRALGQAAQAILPEGTKITIHDQAQKGDPHKVFLEQISVSNAETSKAIVGGTMVVDSGSSRSQSEVHERTLDDKIAESDRRMVEFFVNGKLIPLLRTYGFKFTDTSVFEFDRTESLSLTAHWDIVYELLNYYEVDEEWVSTTFNVPIKGKRLAQPGALPSGKTPSAKAPFTANFQ